MSNEEVRAELLRLRKQVEALSAQRRQHKASPPPEEEQPEADSVPPETEHAIKKQIEDLIKLMREEIHDMPAMPTLAVFMLGVLVGRYLR